jgi:signal transduction histidine kinase
VPAAPAPAKAENEIRLLAAVDPWRGPELSSWASGGPGLAVPTCGTAREAANHHTWRIRMKGFRRVLWSISWLVLGLFWAAGPAAAAGPDLNRYQRQETKDLVRLVEDAAAMVEARGEKAFARLREPGSRWYHGDTYVFVTSLEGVELVNPAFPHLQGVNLMDWRDAYGKRPVPLYIDKVTSDPQRPWGWVHYLWHQPGQLRMEWKTSYVRLAQAPEGKRYVVGAGIYDMKMERAFVVEKVEQAVELIARRGPAAFDAIRAQDGPFVFNDTYVFVDNAQGVELVNPAFPGLEGKSLIRLNNPEGRPIVREYIALALDKGSGWIGYYWPRPGESRPSIKHVYVKRVRHGEETYVVGCGAYLR